MLHGTFVCKCTNYANYGFEKLMYHICSSCQEERALEMYTLAAHAKNKGHWKCEPLVYEAKPALKNTTVILGKMENVTFPHLPPPLVQIDHQFAE